MWYRDMAQADVTFKDCLFSVVGICSTASSFSIFARSMPSTSLPKINAAGSSAWKSVRLFASEAISRA